MLCLSASLAGSCSLPNEEMELVQPYSVPPPPIDSTVKIEGFTYTPASPIKVGDRLTFTASFNRPVLPEAGELKILIGSKDQPLVGYAPNGMLVTANDEERDGDLVYFDGIWTSELIWLEVMGAQQDLPVSAHLEWSNGFVSEEVFAAPLTVLPAEDSAL